MMLTAFLDVPLYSCMRGPLRPGTVRSGTHYVCSSCRLQLTTRCRQLDASPRRQLSFLRNIYDAGLKHIIASGKDVSPSSAGFKATDHQPQQPDQVGSPPLLSPENVSL